MLKAVVGRTKAVWKEVLEARDEVAKEEEKRKVKSCIY